MSWQKCLHVKRCWVRKLSFKIFKTIFQPQHTLRGFSLSRTKTSLILSRFFPPARLAAEVAAKVINQSDILNSSPSHDDIKWLTWKLLLFHAHYSNCLKHFFPSLIFILHIFQVISLNAQYFLHFSQSTCSWTIEKWSGRCQIEKLFNMWNYIDGIFYLRGNRMTILLVICYSIALFNDIVL